MKHIIIIDELKKADKLGNLLSESFCFSTADCEEEFYEGAGRRNPSVILISADFAGDRLSKIIKIIRKTRVTSAAPILVYTTDNDCDHQSAMLDCGADDIMHFPLCKELIIRRINTVMPVHTSDEEKKFDFDELMDSVSEKVPRQGSYQVKSDDFANIYKFVMRGLERSSKRVQVLLMTLSGCGIDSADEYNSKVMSILASAVQVCLRRGDISSICSKNQIVILLMDADDDGGHLVANRIVSNFYGECDDGGYELQYDIRELSRVC
ncbi:MAG: hypothetical protein E7497_07310 [Ruminococcus sp.]|nr:hypothetical protein [Ruminococcus sp.]